MEKKDTKKSPKALKANKREKKQSATNVILKKLIKIKKNQHVKQNK